MALALALALTLELVLALALNKVNNDFPMDFRMKCETEISRRPLAEDEAQHPPTQPKRQTVDGG